MTRQFLFGLTLFVAACAVSPPQIATEAPLSAPVAALTPTAALSLTRAVPIDEGLRAEYGRCDAADSFRGFRFPIRNARGATIWYGCSSDPSQLESLVKLAPTDRSRAAVAFTSKLGLDLDGSWIACNKRGVTDQCGTTLMLPAREGQPCVIPTAPRSRCIPVDADRIPYVVLPAAGPREAPASEFMDSTGIRVGDLGVVIFGGKIVSIIVADTGPFNKIGEGSMALHRALGNDFCRTRDAAGNCTETKRGSSIGRGVTTVVFPGSAPSGLTPETIAEVVNQQGRALYDQLARAYPAQ